MWSTWALSAAVGGAGAQVDVAAVSGTGMARVPVEVVGEFAQGTG